MKKFLLIAAMLFPAGALAQGANANDTPEEKLKKAAFVCQSHSKLVPGKGWVYEEEFATACPGIMKRYTDQVAVGAKARDKAILDAVK